MKKIMFQGDSITDCFRDRSDHHHLGSGYPRYVKEALGEGYEYVNYGISGNTSRAMLARHCGEFFSEQPDVLILLIGINDIWRHYDAWQYDKVELDEYLDNVKRTISRSKELKPSCQVVLIEPYLLPGTSELWSQGGDLYRAFRKATIEEIKPLADLFVPTEDLLYGEYQKGHVYSDDGVHPNAEGCRFIGAYLARQIQPLL